MSTSDATDAKKTKLMRQLVRLTIKPLLHPRVPFKLRRLLINSTGLMQRGIPGVNGVHVQLDGIETYCATPSSQPGPDAQRAPRPTEKPGQQELPKHQRRHILYLHGGGYVFGGLATHRQLLDSLALAGDATLWMPKYRLAPEYPFPAALNDALHCYLTLIEQGIAAENIVLAGDSAGGGLALALAIVLKERHLAPAKALLLISPWVDLTLQHQSIHSQAHLDPMLSPASLAYCARAYVSGGVARGAEKQAAANIDTKPGATRLDNPLCSPLYANLADLPPMVIQVGSDEILVDDAKALYQTVTAANGDATLQVFDGMWHDFQVHAYQLETSTRAVKQLFEWLDSYTSG